MSDSVETPVLSIVRPDAISARLVDGLAAHSDQTDVNDINVKTGRTNQIGDQTDTAPSSMSQSNCIFRERG